MQTLVCRPLNSAEVDAVFEHLPQRAELAQLDHIGADGADRVVDFFLGRETADGHAQAAVREFVAAAQGAQHVAGLKAGRSTGRAGGNRQTLDAHDQGFALDEVEAHVQVLRNTVLHAAVDKHLLQVLEAIEQALLQRIGLGIAFSHLFLGDAESLAHAHDLVGRQCSRAHAALMATAVDLRLQADTGLAAHIQGTHALGTIGLVRSHAHQVHRQLGQVDLDAARGLRCIDMQQNALFSAQRADGGNVLDDADFVVHEQHADQDGVGTQGGLEGLEIEQAVGLHVHHGLVLGLERDQVLALALVEMRRTLDGQVDGFRCTAGPHDLAWIRADQVGHLATRLLDGFLRFPAPCMASRSGIAEMLAQPGDHGVHHARVHGGGRAIVEIDGEMRGHKERKGAELLRIHPGRRAHATQPCAAAPCPQGVKSGFGEGVAQRKDRIRRIHADGLDHRRGRDRAAHDGLVFDLNALGQLFVHELLQRHRIEEFDHALIQRGPQFVGHAAAGFAQTVFLAATLGGVNRLVHGDDDVGHGDVTSLAGQRIATAGSTGGLDQFMATQLAEQLFQVRQRNLLTLADGCQRDGAIVLAQGQIDHGSDRKTAFGGETHYELLQSGLYVTETPSPAFGQSRAQSPPLLRLVQKVQSPSFHRSLLLLSV
ncbi:hypothetical protein FQR65_LT20226 [Abscondita terminalis]|nr:hypothetical protein FQR65_LT20226 [Abscondita terminalis]